MSYQFHINIKRPKKTSKKYKITFVSDCISINSS